MRRSFLMIGFILGWVFFQSCEAAPLITIVSAENFYASVAKEIGGQYVQVTSILNKPDQDPHLFTIAPGILKHLAKADLIVYNGLGYDPWIQNFLSISPKSDRTVICVAQQLGKKEGDNPHIWYDPVTMPVYAKALLDFLEKKDSVHSSEYQVHYQRFIKDYQSLIRLITQLRAHYKGIAVIATEPIFNDMAKALGFVMRGIPFQTSIMNGVDPGPRQVQAFQDQLQHRRVRILFYNKQVNSPSLALLLKQAQQSAIPIIGVTEIQPSSDISYIEWMRRLLEQIEKVLDERDRI